MGAGAGGVKPWAIHDFQDVTLTLDLREGEGGALPFMRVEIELWSERITFRLTEDECTRLHSLFLAAAARLEQG